MRWAIAALVVASTLALHGCSSYAISAYEEDHPYGVAEVEFVPTAAGDLPAPPPVRVTETISARGKVRFNGAVRENLVDVQVVGLEVVYDPSEDHPLNRYHEAKNVTSMTIAADTVIIRDQLSLPGTDVTIQARKLVFEETDEPAFIQTAVESDPYARPTPRPTRAERRGKGKPHRIVPGENGGEAARGGHLAFLVHELEVQSNKAINPLDARCMQMGETGFDGGAALEGFYDGMALQVGDGADAAIARTRKLLDAQPGGIPGAGGPSGDLTTTVEIRCVRAAASGGRTNGARGGRTPKMFQRIVGKAKGKDLYPVDGEPGEVSEEIRVENLPEYWGSPLLLSPIVERIEDLYRAGRTDEAKAMTLSALEWAPYVPKEAWGDDGTFAAKRGRLFTLAEHLAAGLDYFGNPEGWVPLLSFEANYTTYEKESRRAVRTLLMTHWLEQFWKEQDERAEVLQASIDEHEAEVEWLRESIANARALLPELERESAEIREQVEQYMNELEANEEDIRERLEKKGAWREAGSAAMVALGTAATIIAFSNPGTGTIAAIAVIGGATAGGTRMVDTPPLRPDGTGASASFRSILIEDEIAEARQAFAEIDPFTSRGSTAVFHELDEVGESYAKATRRYVEQQMDQARMSSPDYDAEGELSAMLAADEEFQMLFDNLVTLISRKQVYGAKLAETRVAVETATARIQEALWAIDSMQNALRANAERIDPVSREVLRQTRRNAKDRLVKYQYYLAKSYEYRMLESCPIHPETNRVYEHVESLFGTGNDPNVPMLDLESPLVDELALIYQEDLRRIAELTIEGLESDRFDPVVGTYTIDLAEDELAELNATGSVEVGLADHAVIFEADRNARIVGMSIDPEDTAFDAKGRGDYAANLDLTIEPAERSFIRWHDRTYGFNYRRPFYTNLVMWGYSWRAPDGPGNAMRLSDESRSLMATLVDERFGDETRVRRIHFRPSAHGSIVVRKEISSTKQSVDIEVESLALSIEIEKSKSF